MGGGVEKEGARRGRLGLARAIPSPSSPTTPIATPYPGSRAHPALTPTYKVPGQFAPSLRTTFEADRPTNLQTGNRGDEVLRGRSSTRDTGALVVVPFSGVSETTIHSSNPRPKSTSFLY